MGGAWDLGLRKDPKGDSLGPHWGLYTNDFEKYSFPRVTTGVQLAHVNPQQC